MSRRSDRQMAIRASLLEMTPDEETSSVTQDEYSKEAVEIELEYVAYQKASFIKVQLKAYGGFPADWLKSQAETLETTYIYEALCDLWEADSD